HEVGLLGRDHLREDARHGEWLELVVGLDEDGAVRAHGEAGAELLLRGLAADRHEDDLATGHLLLDAPRFFDAVLVERVHDPLDVVGDDHVPPALTLMTVSGSGTRLTVTRIFTVPLSLG